MTSTVPKATATALRTDTWRGTGVATQILVLSEKSLRRLVTDPKLLLFSVLQPLILLLLFGQIFNSISKTPDFPAGVSYIDFLVPAIMVNTAMQSALLSGTGLNEEIKNGMVARFRTLPIWLGSVLVARSVFDLARGAIRLALMVLLAVALFGFSPVAASWASSAPSGSPWPSAGGWAGCSSPSRSGCATASPCRRSASWPCSR